MTPLEAFDNFLAWVHYSGKWDALNDKEKNRVITARRDRDGLRGQRHQLGAGRIKRILDDYAPGRYEFREVVILKEDK